VPLLRTLASAAGTLSPRLPGEVVEVGAEGVGDREEHRRVERSGRGDRDPAVGLLSAPASRPLTSSPRTSGPFRLVR
jgi:hypothetical protein